MHTVSVIASEWLDLATWLAPFHPTANGPDGFAVEVDGKFVFVHRNPWGVSETEPDVLANLLPSIRTPHFHSVDSSHLSAVRTLLGILADDPRLIVDPCEDGTFMHGPEFVRVIRAFPNWDWRYAPIPTKE